ncbi:MAG: hypothetical protein J6M06_00345 [Synergistaceae bacterium]|nr:hypothetical protein [Synergistaceae bacterium]
MREPDIRNLSEPEIDIVAAIVQNGIDDGWSFTENDPDPQFRNSRNFAEIVEGIDAVEECVLLMRKGDETMSVLLVPGNDEYIISDHSANFEPYFDRWVRPVIEKIEDDANAMEP